MTRAKAYINTYIKYLFCCVWHLNITFAMPFCNSSHYAVSCHLCSDLTSYDSLVLYYCLFSFVFNSLFPPNYSCRNSLESPAILTQSRVAGGFSICPDQQWLLSLGCWKHRGEFGKTEGSDEQELTSFISGTAPVPLREQTAEQHLVLDRISMLRRITYLHISLCNAGAKR